MVPPRFAVAFALAASVMVGWLACPTYTCLAHEDWPKEWQLQECWGLWLADKCASLVVWIRDACAWEINWFLYALLITPFRGKLWWCVEYIKANMCLWFRLWRSGGPAKEGLSPIPPTDATADRYRVVWNSQYVEPSADHTLGEPWWQGVEMFVSDTWRCTNCDANKFVWEVSEYKCAGCKSTSFHVVA